MSWTKDRLEKSIALWNAGKSGAEIAKEIGGVTRNAVVGKINRLVSTGDKRIRRTGRAPHTLIDWTDEKLLKLLSFREHHDMSFSAISEQLGIGARSCAAKYHEVIADLGHSERA